MYEIAEFDNQIPGNNIINVRKGSNVKYESFEQLAQRFESCRPGTKLDGYFIRGSLKPFHRADKNISGSNVFVIDGDSTVGGDAGAPPIAEIRGVLSSYGVEYVLYTTHSHSTKKNKYRVLIPTQESYDKDTLKRLAPGFVKALNDSGCMLQYVKEMGTMSQPWFTPTRDDPNDGLFEYHYEPGTPLDVESYLGEVKSVGERLSETTTESKSIDDHLKDISNGNYHQAIIALSYGKAKDGITQAQNLAEMRAFMMLAPNQDDRWQERYQDLERTVKGAYDRVAEQSEDIDDYGITYSVPNQDTLPWPPGMMGDIMTLSMNQQTYPHEEIALASALGLVAGIAGRKFNVDSMDGLGLNIYIMLAAPSGTGKSSISNFITKNIPTSDGAIKSSFIGPSNFTGATGIIKNHIKDARCMVMVMSEMAHVLDSKSGDQAGKRRFILDAYGQSGHNDVLSGTVFSSTDNSVPDLNSPSFSLVGESTPEKLLRILRRDESLSDGWLPRFSVFRINEINELPNRNYIKKEDVPVEIRERIIELVTMCETIQSQSTFECHMLTMDEEVMYDHMVKWRKIYKEHNGINELKSVMATRMHIKALKYAGLATVINKAKNEKNCLVIEEREWLWALDMIQYEWNGIDSFFQGTFSGSPLDDAATDIIGKYILLALDKRLARDTKCPAKLYNTMNPLMRDARAISVSGLRQVCGTMLNDIGNNFKDGFDIAIEYMIGQGYVKREKEWKPMLAKRKCDVILITQNFYDRLQSKL